MVLTLQQILRPIFFTCFIMGLGFFPRKRSKIRWIKHLNILYSVTVWSAYTYLLFYLRTYFTKKILFDSIAMELCETSNFLLSIISVIMSFYHQKRFEISIKKLAAVDDTLEKLGTPKMYEKLHMKSKQMIIGWIVYSLAMNFFDTVWWNSFREITSLGLYMAHIVNYCIHINTFVDMMFIFFLWYIGTRFDKVNDHVRCLLMTEDHGLTMRSTCKKSVIVLHRYIHYKQTLWTSMHLHLELSRLTRELNLIFTVQLTFEMATFFLYLTSLFYYLYWMIIQEEREKFYVLYDWISIILWVSLFLVRLYIVNYICEYVTVKANESGKLYHQLTNIYRYADIWKEIYQFILQPMHHSLKFTGMGFFYFGYEFLQKFCLAILMYVIIMVQFKIFIIY